MRDTEDREQILLLDVSKADNSAQALGLLETFVKKAVSTKSAYADEPRRISILSGSLMLSQGVLSKMRQICRQDDVTIDTVYSSVPQTQQAALDEGFYVKEKPLAEAAMKSEKSQNFSFDLSVPFDTYDRDRKHFTSLGESFFQPGQAAASLAEAPKAAVSDAIDFNTFPFPAESPQERGAERVPERTLLDSESTAIRYKDPSPKLSGFDFPRNNADVKARVAAETALKPSEKAPEKLEAAPPRTSLLRTEAEAAGTELPETETEFQTLYLKQNLRSGRVVRFDGNIVIVGDVHAGSEISASGDITVWGELKGIAHAGNKGNYKAEIRALRIEAIQLRIADYIARRPDRIFYHKDYSGDSLWAELAKVADGEIKIVQEQIGR